MGRTLSTTMQDIFAGGERKIDWSVELTFPDASYFRFATAPLTIGGNTYTNDLESVGEIKQSIELPIDRVRIAVQNKDRVLGQHVAVNWQKWRRAQVVLGRLYRGGPGLALSEWKEMFRGAVQKPNANDLQVFFDVIADTVAPGGIVTNRTLDPVCWYVYKHPFTCGYAGPESDCNHLLKSSGGCDGRGNSHRYGGMEHRYNPDVSVPGTGGNQGGGGSFPTPPYCPRIDQFVLVKGDDGRPMPLMAGFFTADYDLFNPITRRFYRTKHARLRQNQPISEVIASNGAVGYSSPKHRILWYKEHANGEPLDRFCTGDPVLGWARNRLVNTRCLIAQETGERGDVMEIEMEDGHIYCYGDSPDKLIVCHNRKDDVDL
ncbi:MAG: hypothetical protein AB7U76_26220 [Pirellulales bacterium]